MQYIFFVPTNRLDDPKNIPGYHPSMPSPPPPCDLVAYTLQSLIKIVLNKWMVAYLYHLHFV